jgi:transcriptional/translational regulatory protein YebC/TACO1
MGRAFEFRKGRKMKRWSAMAKAFTKLERHCSNAWEGGQILKLIQIKSIQNSKTKNMPKENVERAIKKQLIKILQIIKKFCFWVMLLMGLHF